MGKWIEPAVRPLGWDWRIGCAAIASFPAREVVVATLGVIYNLGEEQDEDVGLLKKCLEKRHLGRHGPQSLQPAGGPLGHGLLRPLRPVRLDARRHSPRNGHLALAAFTFVYMTALAYVGALSHLSNRHPADGLNKRKSIRCPGTTISPSSSSRPPRFSSPPAPSRSLGPHKVRL